MRYISYFLFGCRAGDDHAVGPEWDSNAFILDSSMYADGCELHLRLDSGDPPNAGQQYLPAASSLPLVRRIIAEANLDPRESVYIPVAIRFRQTTRQRIISCGWVSPTVNEIDILAISRR